MDEIKVVPLGAGQDVGRSCILLSMGGKNIMFDCGMHMGFNDDRRFPDFSYIVKDGKLHTVIDCVIISHFHLDHCGALPYMSEMVGYDGPIYMTHPTKAMCPILLEDFRKVAVERKGEQNFFTAEMIKSCMKKVIAVNLHQTVKVDDRLSIKAYYAGHVLGAAMFHVKVGSQTVVYTGDYNMTPDRHLGAAWIDQCQPDLLISESTYATTIRDSKRCRERDFLKKVHDCVEKNGKVLIPVFALGRAQELCILLETYWDRMNLKAPIYFTGGLTEKANQYYKLFITWTNQKIKNTFVQRNMFDFRHIKPFERALMDNPGPMVVFATPGMLHGGMSLQIFKKWCTNENNTIIMPGYCVAGTVGWKILNGQRKLEFENKQIVDVKMSVQYMSFSAHADAKGIMQLIRHCQPKNVMLVHGEEIKMEFLKGKVLQEFNVPCLMPANGETAIIPTYHNIPIELSMNVLKRSLADGSDHHLEAEGGGKQRRTITAALMLRQDRELPQLCAVQDCMKELNLPEHQVRFSSSVIVDDELSSNQIVSKLARHLKDRVKAACVSAMTVADENISISDSVLIKIESNGDDVQKQIMVSWSLQDENIGSQLLAAVRDYSYAFVPAVKSEVK